MDVAASVSCVQGEPWTGQRTVGRGERWLTPANVLRALDQIKSESPGSELTRATQTQQQMGRSQQRQNSTDHSSTGQRKCAAAILAAFDDLQVWDQCHGVKMTCDHCGVAQEELSHKQRPQDDLEIVLILHVGCFQKIKMSCLCPHYKMLF